eukprot:CAMPEP_0177581188 /NCGR_PEP_ID=MMETSP0419_2-20121207/2002_1 /TAXON_ID=582737 /ORGANISM="Tetraselmis sp., Strain GSL018" /LENGTH=406 /DNA_ID=CAMNT_0019070189 /DNA_START=307 /DNA_END=1524 /DNA_ORIENTATION=-
MSYLGRSGVCSERGSPALGTDPLDTQDAAVDSLGRPLGTAGLSRRLGQVQHGRTSPRTPDGFEARHSCMPSTTRKDKMSLFEASQDFSPQKAAAECVISQWLSPLAPPELEAHLSSWLTGESAARPPTQSLAGSWQAWLTDSAPPSVVREVSRWASNEGERLGSARRAPAPPPSVRGGGDLTPRGEGGLGRIVGPLPAPSPLHVSTPAEAEVVRALLPPGSCGTDEPRFVGVWGPSGAGKTALAAAAVRSPAVRRAFVGGIAWADLSGADDDALGLCLRVARLVDGLPGPDPPWPPLSLVDRAGASPADVRAWVAVRLAALPGQSLLVLDGVTEPGQTAGLAALGASLLVLSPSRAPLAGLRSPARGRAAGRFLAEPASLLREVMVGPLPEREAATLLLAASGCPP